MKGGSREKKREDIYTHNEEFVCRIRLDSDTGFQVQKYRVMKTSAKKLR